MIYRYFLTTISLAAALTVAGCEGDDGLPGAAGLGFVPTPPADQSLGEYDPALLPADQTLAAQLVSGSGVWEITLDHKVQLDLGDGTPPVLADTVLYDADHDELWITVDGVDIAVIGDISIGCFPGIPSPCVAVQTITSGDYAELSQTFIGHGPAINTTLFTVDGVKTALADMPATGTASYAGIFGGVVDYTSNTTVGPDTVSGSANVGADFGTGAVTFGSVGAGLIGGSNYSLAGSGTVSGNSYSGTVSGSYDDGSSTQFPTATFVATQSSFEGSFYGPVVTGLSGDIGPQETAGVVEANTDPLDPFPATLIGGFVSTIQ